MAFTISGTGGLTFPDATTMTTGSQAVKAWVQLNGVTGTVRNSFNISSATRVAGGRYTITFTTAMPNANYAYVGMARSGNGSYDVLVEGTYLYTETTTSFQIQVINQAFSSFDATVVSVAVFA